VVLASSAAAARRLPLRALSRYTSAPWAGAQHARLPIRPASERNGKDFCFEFEGYKYKPSWKGHVDFGDLKVKLLT